VGVEAVVVPGPGLAAIPAEAEAVEGGHEYQASMTGGRAHLVDVVLDVEERAPRGPAVRGPQHTADVDVDVDRAVGARADRAHVGRCAPGRVPGVAALRLVEAGHASQLLRLQTQ